MKIYFHFFCFFSTMLLVIMLSACNNSGNDSSALYQSLIGSASADVESETTQTDDITIASAAIEVLTGNQKSERKIFKDGETLILGRDVSCQLVFDGSYKYVSREHCSVLFDYKQGGFYVTDFSTNGTYFENESRLEKAKTIFVPDGTKLKLADEKCIVELKIFNDP